MSELQDFWIDKITLRSGEIVESHFSRDRDEWSALRQVTRQFYDCDAPRFFGVYGSAKGDLRIQDLDDAHYWSVTWEE